MEAVLIPPDSGAGLGEALSTPASSILMDPLSLLRVIRDRVIPRVEKRSRSISAQEERDENRYTPLNNFQPAKTPGSRVQPPPSGSSAPRCCQRLIIRTCSAAHHSALQLPRVPRHAHCDSGGRVAGGRLRIKAHPARGFTRAP